MNGHREIYRQSQEATQLDQEIIQTVRTEGPVTAYRVIQLISAPPETIRYRMKRLVELGYLDCVDARIGKHYTVPSKPRKVKPRKAEEDNTPKKIGRPKLGKLPSEIASLKEAEKRQG